MTVQPHLCKSRSDKEVTLTEGELNTPLPRVCLECDGRMDRHDKHAVCVQGMPVLGRIHLLRVWMSRSRCRQCGHVESQKAGFVAQGHRIMRRLERLLEENGGLYRCYLLVDTVEKHLERIIHAIVLGLSTGKLEGNNMIKNSRKPSQIWLSHKILI